MNDLLKKAGRHVAALVLFVGLVAVFFSPAVFDGKVIVQGDDIKATGMGHSQMEKYARTAQPGEFSAWSDAMFGGMPYVTGYGAPAPELPSYTIIDDLLKMIGYRDAAIIFVALVSFYLLMCVMGINWWLAVAGAIAFAFASYNMIIIEAGHIVKAYVIGYMPVTIAGMILLFKRSYLWGSVLFLLGVALSLGNGHIQITYYLMLLCLFLYAGFSFRKINEKACTEWLRTSLIMLACVALAVLPNAKQMYSNWDLGQHSIRGKSELTPRPDASGKVEKASSGLDKEYAFQWSYGWKELMTVLVPNVYGGSSAGTLDSSSELYQEMKKNGIQVGKEVQTYTYWGDKVFTSGPVYFGAVVCFLFILGMFVIRNNMKWWMFGGTVFLTFLALGRNFDAFNDIMFHYLPFYNKFRTVEMALVIPGFVFPLIAMWGLKDVFSGKVDPARLKRGFLWAVGLTGGLCLLLWGIPSLFLDFQSTYDAQFKGQVPDWYYNALLVDRGHLATSDAFRSLIFILLSAALLLLYQASKTKEKIAPFIYAGLMILILVDLWTVDRRYLNEQKFVKQKPADMYPQTAADKAILADTDGTFRVINLNNPWQETNTSYYHHSIGGYHAVKLRRYQELIDYRLNGELMGIIGALQEAQTLNDILPALKNAPSLNMLNTRYIVFHPDQEPIKNPYAFGNAWFVEEVKLVADADAEIEALNTIDPLITAVVDEHFQAALERFVPQKDSTAMIRLTDYRPNRLTYKTHTEKEQIAVFSEIYYQPGWTAFIDGTEVPHFRADWLLRGLKIPAGEHTVVFEFKPSGYVTAAYVSSYSAFAILLLLLGVIGWSGWKYKKNRLDSGQE